MFCPACRHHFADGFRHCPNDGAALRRSARATRELVVDPFVGQTLDGRYRIEHRLGEGRLGVVYAARHVALDKLVAVKILRREMGADIPAVRRFSQEARGASSVGHPAIVDVTDLGRAQDQVYLVMEHLEGETLERRLVDRGRLTPAEAVDIARQIARGLGAAHRKGIVHRDLKPANVFLQLVEAGPPRVKILDFGLSKIATQQRATLLGTFLATAEYVAPEQARGDDVDARADVYALGVILYEMLAGRVPFRDSAPSKTLLLHLQAPVPPLLAAGAEAHVSPELEAAVLEMLGKSREDRFASMEAVDAALAAVERRLQAPVEVRAPANAPTAATALAPPLRSVARQPTAATRAREGRWPIALGVAVAALGGSVAGAWLARGELPMATIAPSSEVRLQSVPPILLQSATPTAEPARPRAPARDTAWGGSPIPPAGPPSEMSVPSPVVERGAASRVRPRPSRRPKRDANETSTSEPEPAPGLLPFPTQRP